MRTNRRLYTADAVMANGNNPVFSGKNHHKSAKAGLYTYRTVVYIILIILTLVCLFPFINIIINCSWSNADIQKGFHWWFGNYFAENWNALISDSHLGFRQAFINSLLIAVISSVLTVYFSALTAYATHIYTFKGKKAITTFILCIMMIPTQVSAMGLVVICNQLHLLNQLWVIIVPAIASPVTYFYMKQYLESVLPFEVIEAARVDGASELRIFHQIVLPILKPALAVQFIFAYVANWNNYFMPAMLLQSSDTKTLPLVIASLKASSPDTFNLGEVYMLIMITILPLIVIYLIFSRSIIKNLTSGAVKG